MKAETGDVVTTKITRTGLQALRFLAALTDEKQYQVLERVLQEAMAKALAQLFEEKTDGL
jgi:hypothetical protein